jgi:hypothetical protein
MLLSPGGGGKDLVKDGFDSADDFLGKFCLSTRTVGSTAANNDDVAVAVLLLEQDVPPLHLALLHVPQHRHRVRVRVRDDERLQAHVDIAEPLFDLLDALVKLDLWIARPEIPDTLGVHEDHMLHPVREQPEDEIGVEIAGLEESHTTALAQVAQQVEFSGFEEGGVSIVERLEILDEPALSLVQRGGADLDDLCVEIEQGLIQMLAEPDRLHAPECPRLEVAFLDRDLQFFELGGDLLLRLVDQDAVAALFGSFPDAQEVRVVLGEVTILQVRQFPLALAERVVALGVLPEQGDGNLIPQTHFLERIEGQFFSRNLQPVPALIGEQSLDCLSRQVQVVPAALGLEMLQLEGHPVEVEEGHMPRVRWVSFGAASASPPIRPPDFIA